MRETILLHKILKNICKEKHREKCIENMFPEKKIGKIVKKNIKKYFLD